MHPHRVPLLLLALTAAALASEGVLLKAAAPLFSPWAVTETAPAPTARMPIIVALRHRNLASLPGIVHSVSDPRSPQYGRHLTVTQIADHTRPESAHVGAVQAWLDGLACSLRGAGDQFHCQLTVADVERLFATTVTRLTNAETGQAALRAGSLHTPPSVAAAVAAVYGTHGLPLPPRRAKLGAGQGTYPVTPATITSRYNVSGVKASGNVKVRQAVAEFQGQFANQTDLTEFFSKYVPNAQPGDEQVYKYIGEKLTGEGIEALLDIQYIMGVAPGVKTEFWEFPGNDFCLDLKNWTATLLSDQDVPLVHSISYGWQGNLTQIGCMPDEVTAIDTAFQQIAARGITLLFASGDSGSGEQNGCPIFPSQQFQGSVITNNTAHSFADCCNACSKDARCAHWTYNLQTQYCTTTGPGATSKPDPQSFSGTPPSKMLWPIWPASSPWVTAVGATRFINQQPGPEMATDSFGSGGGLSFLFDQPAWQKDAVNQYFTEEPAQKLPDPSTYRRDGRGTPDLAALGDGYQVVVHGQIQSVGGTSASTPAFAAMVSLINDVRIASGKAALGYLNLWIYQQQASFMDVTVGSNRFGRGPFPIPDGYDCTKGWDPVTGFGTPNFYLLLESAKMLP